MSTDLSRAQSRLALYYAAEADILERGQSYAIRGRSLTRADIREIRAAIARLEAEVARLENGGGIGRKRLVNK